MLCSYTRKEKKKTQGISQGPMVWTGNDRGNSAMINAAVMHTEGEK